MKTNQLLMLALLAGGGFLVYKSLSQPAPPPNAGTGATYIPAGGTVGGYVNTTGAPTWVTATGVILNGLGQVLASIPWSTIIPGSSGGGTTTSGGGWGTSGGGYAV